LVEQNARMALELANNAYVLEVGNIVLQGTAGELSNDPEVRRAYLGG
ncbi:MAG: ABC transporter ATP-binding protein, partial [Deltaproteobacteria bacterium]|nr:ABC transporter ATP-binding protein [Deltaproteobacteria bacterium]